MTEGLTPKAQIYASRRKVELAETLGSGKDGIVLVAKDNSRPADVAIKLFELPETYLREKAVYNRLRNLGITNVLGFNVPQALGFDDDLLVIEMTIVRRPFVLDFAGAHLDVRPIFPPEVWTDWETEKREQFEGRWRDVQRVLDAFEELGIYLLDVSPGNIAFQV